jgi:transcriptional regulator with XRE-family HTH domain
MEIHERIRKLREDKKLKLRDIYKHIHEQWGPEGITYVTLKRIQSGKTKPKKTSLYQIALVLGVSLEELEGKDPNALITFIDKNDPPGKYDYTPVKAYGDKLSTIKAKNMLAQKLALAPGTKTRTEKDPSPTENVTYQKWVYGLKGEIACVVGNERCVVTPGNVCLFDSHHEHYFENLARKTSYCLVVQTPPHL